MRGIGVTLLLLTACGPSAATDAGQLDAATRDAAVRDAARPDARADDAGAAVRCQERAASRGWTVCSADESGCSIVFEDGAGCPAVCASVGLECSDALDDDPGMCLPLGSDSLGCGDTTHRSDFCVCGAPTATDGGVDAGAPDGGSDAGAPDAGTVACSAERTRVWLVGDSTVAPDSGWGDFFEAELTGATVENRAVGGRSSKSFYDEGRFDAVREALAPGDYVLIQFGHNDAKPEAYRRTEPGSPPEYDDSYRQYLTRYLDEAEARGAIPILVTSVSRMVFGSDGALRRTHGDYPAAMRRLAADRGVALLDLEQHSFEVFDDLGEAETLRLYAEDGDLTHFPPDKAFRVADMVTTLLRRADSPLRCFLTD
ncbi:MAG: rhamnogalacturonan acetylesterase [Sandaracinaceae bacterium]